MQKVSIGNMTLKGIDISNWQKGLNLEAINFDFVIIKATEGINFVDPCCDPFFQKAKSMNKLLGFYHFARSTVNDAKAEAQFFYKNTRNYFGQAIPVLDWEDKNTWNVAWAKTWLDEVYRLSGVKPLIYMSEYVVNSNDWSSVVKGDYGLWVAKYRDSSPDYNYDMTYAGNPPKVKWWSGYAIWQWTGSGRLFGYNYDLDCDVFYGDKTAWLKYAGIKTSQEPQKPSNPLDQYSDEELAERVIEGLYGNGNERKKALGNRYDAVQKIVDEMMQKPIYYTVQKGDNLTAIAKKYGTTWYKLKQLNNLKNANQIFIGQKIRVK